VAAVRALGRRDADAIDALLAAMEASEGRVRLECRDALCEATGQSFGLMTEEWRLWWSANREGWKAPAGPAKVPPPEIALPRLFGVPTASTRIAILVCRGAAMRKPVKRRAFGNDGEPSPAPAVDSALKIATWELSQALGALHDEQEFVVIVFGPDLHASSRKLARPTRDNVKRACGLVARFEPEGGSGVAPALRLALRMGVSAKVEDLALGGAGAVDTIFVVGGALPLRDPGFRRLRRLRRISFFTVALAALSAPPK
jgi:hypothetical protein